MSLLVPTQAIPLTTDADGVVRLGTTRVSLDTVVAAFHDGMTAEAIVEQYPSLRLADVYSAIGFYLSNTIEVENYLNERKGVASDVRAATESRAIHHGIRERLLSRKSRSGI